jgi:hypothetical protein
MKRRAARLATNHLAIRLNKFNNQAADNLKLSSNRPTRQQKTGPGPPFAGKSVRSHSITNSNQTIADCSKLKPRQKSSESWKDTLDPSSAAAGLTGSVNPSEVKDSGSGLPRTLSTSVLRIKHRRTFWERVTRYE